MESPDSWSELLRSVMRQIDFTEQNRRLRNETLGL
jgi:hypothetical protein